MIWVHTMPFQGIPMQGEPKREGEMEKERVKEREGEVREREGGRGERITERDPSIISATATPILHSLGKR